MDSEKGGIELYALLQKLDINTGKSSTNQINAWYDNDAVVDFLDWFRLSIDSTNVLTPSEQEMYLSLLNNDLMLTGESLDEEVDDLEATHPDIFNVDNNLFDIECLEEERLIFTEDLKLLDTELQIQKKLYRIINKEVQDQTMEEAEAMCAMNKAIEESLRLSSCLEQINQKLKIQLQKCCHKLNDSNSNTLLSNIDTTDHEIFHRFVLSRINNLNLNDVLENISNMVSKYDRNKLESIFDEEPMDVLEDIAERITESLVKHVEYKARYEGEKVKSQYLTSINGNKLPSSNRDMIDEFKEQESVIISEVKELAAKTAEKYVGFSKRNDFYSDINDLISSLDITGISRAFDKILTNAYLLVLFFQRDKHFIRNTINVFIEVRKYIKNNLENYEKSTADLVKAQNEQKNCLLTIEEKYNIIPLIYNTVTETQTECTLKSVLQQVNTFRSEYIIQKNKLFVEDVNRFKSQIHTINAYISQMKSYLYMGPTKSLSVMPYSLYTTLMDIMDAMDCGSKFVKQSTRQYVKAQEKLRNNWNRKQNLLWMYYLSGPDKLESIRGEIEQEIKRRQK